MRYLPLTDQNRKDMLARIGVDAIDDLFRDVPAGLLLKDPVDLPPHQSELAVDRHFRALGEDNIQAGSVPFFVGCGAYRHHVPATVDHVIQRGEFLTSYTPYQPEIAQGTLQYLFEFQSQVADLLAMDVANASLYDGSTACSEAVLMAHRVTRRKKAVLHGNLHPHYRDVTRTQTKFLDDALIIKAPNAADPQAALKDALDEVDEETASLVIQYPDVYGHIFDLAEIAERVHEKGALLIVAVSEVVSLGAIKAPGEMGADIVVAEGQSIGNGLNFGGPYLGLFATQDKYVRQMPGRLCGETEDADGRRGYVLTLSTREQHIRREKATSNICTNSGLCSLAFTVHMALLGEAGLRRLARINHAKAVKTAERLAKINGVEVLNKAFFNEFTVRIAGDAEGIVEKLAGMKILAGVPVKRIDPHAEGADKLIILAVTETVQNEDIEALAKALEEAL